MMTIVLITMNVITMVIRIKNDNNENDDYG